MAYIHPLAVEHHRKRWIRPDAYRFAAPGTAEAKMPGYLHPWAEVARQDQVVADEAKARALAEQDEFEREVLALRHELAKLKLELELRRFRRKYSPDQPRVPAGNPDGGQWTDGSGGNVARVSTGDRGGGREADVGDSGQRDGRIRLAGDPPVPLQRIHLDSTYERDPEARRSLEYWRGKSTDTIVDSLKPGGPESLKTYPDGRLFNGNTRVKILEERGYDVNSLPRDMWRPSPTNPPRSRGGGGVGGGLPTLQ